MGWELTTRGHHSLSKITENQFQERNPFFSLGGVPCGRKGQLRVTSELFWGTGGAGRSGLSFPVGTGLPVP